MGRRRAVLLALVVALVFAPASRAGNNAGGTVGLSWDAAGDSTTGTMGSGLTFPLFLHIHDVADVQQLAINIRWIPYDSTGQCYSVVPAQADSACGWATDGMPSGPFAGDSSYTWSIHFPSGSDKNCVVYWASTTTCDTTPSAKFYIASALVMDSNGAIDTLRDVADVRLIGQNPDTSYFGPRPQRAAPASAAALRLVAMPNPVSASTTIRFAMPGPMAFRFGIYDVSGRLVRRVSATPNAAGIGQFVWDLTAADGSRVGAGVYFARLSTAVGSRVIPVTVLK